MLSGKCISPSVVIEFQSSEFFLCSICFSKGTESSRPGSDFKFLSVDTHNTTRILFAVDFWDPSQVQLGVWSATQVPLVIILFTQPQPPLTAKHTELCFWKDIGLRTTLWCLYVSAWRWRTLQFGIMLSLQPSLSFPLELGCSITIKERKSNFKGVSGQWRANELWPGGTLPDSQLHVRCHCLEDPCWRLPLWSILRPLLHCVCVSHYPHIRALSSCVLQIWHHQHVRGKTTTCFFFTLGRVAVSSPLGGSFYNCFFPLIYIFYVLCLNPLTHGGCKTLICRIITNHGENLLQCYWGKLKLWTRTYLYAETARHLHLPSVGIESNKVKLWGYFSD